MSGELCDQNVAATEAVTVMDADPTPIEPTIAETPRPFLGMTALQLLRMTGPNGMPVVIDRPAGLDETLRYADYTN